MIIQLKDEMETLLIPLYGRAKMSQAGVFTDPYAEESIKKLEYDNKTLKVQKKTQIMLAMRAALFDNIAKHFIDSNPNCMVLHLGCGLDARYLRLGFSEIKWYDLDFPEVIDIKKQLYKESSNFRYISSSVSNLNWLDGIELDGKALLIIAEGLFMYLSQSEIEALLETLKIKFNRYTIVFDAFSKKSAKKMKRHASLKRTSAMIKWGVDDPKEIEFYAQGLHHIETCYLTDDYVIKMLPKRYKWMFRFARHFKSAQEAHRVYVMKMDGITKG